ncbi:MAG: thymidine kinase [archaeon]
MIGWSELIFGSMYCGKSEELIRRLKRARYAGQKFQLFKPSLDDRYGVDVVATHENNKTKKEIEKIIDIHINEDDFKGKKSLMSEITHQLEGAMEALVVEDSRDLLNHVNKNTNVIGIDEVQFFDEELIEIIDILIQDGKRVICAGLDLYASGQPFGIIPTLACTSKYVDKLHAVCMDCGNDAYISYKIDNDLGNKQSKVDVGSEGKYIALCEQCKTKREGRNKNE